MTKAEFQILFEKFYSPLCNYAFAILKDHDDAEDVVQNVFVDFWKKEDKASIKVEFEHYLIRAVKFKCIDLHRKSEVKRKYEAEAIHESEISEEDNDDKENVMEALHLAIAQLPEKTKEVFIKSKLEGMSYKEIADELNISVKTVENQMGRAFKHLRKILADNKGLLLLLGFLIKYF